MSWKRWLLVSVLLLVTGGALLRVAVARYDFGRFKPRIIRVVEDATGRELEVKGDLRVSVGFSVGFSVAVSARDVFLANAPWGSRPQMLSAERIEARVRLLPLLFGDVSLKRVTLTGVDVLLERDAEGRGNWEFSRVARPGEAPEAFSLAPGLVPDEVRIERLRVSLRQDEATRHLALERLELSPGDDPSVTALRARAEWDGQPVVVAGRVGAPSRAFAQRSFPVDLRWTLGTADLQVEGTIGDVVGLQGVDLKFHASGGNLGDLGPYFGTALPTVGPFEASAHLHGGPKEFVLDDLAATIGGSDFRGSGRVEAREPPRISLTLASSLVDLTPFLAVAGREQESPPRGTEGVRRERFFSEDPMSFDVLGRLDARIVLDAKGIRVRDARVGDVHLDLEVEGRALRIERLEASYAGAKLSGSARLAPGSPPQAAVKLSVQDLDLGGFVRDVGGGDSVRGRLDFAADLESRGDSVRALMAGLGGSIGAVMGKGRLSNYLDLVAVNLTDKVLPFWGRHKGGNELACAVVQFDVRKGRATSRAFVFDTATGLLLGGGTIDLGTEKVDFLLVPRPKDPSVTSLATKLRVSGSITAPTVAPDATALVTKGAKFLSVFALGPAGLLVPFVNLGAHQANPCDIESIKELGLRPPAPE